MHLRSMLLLIALSLSSHAGMAAVTAAPPIELPALTGDFRLDDLKGKVVYLDFWASWCKPCKQSFPWMHEMKKTYGEQGLEIVAVNLDTERQLADEFLSQVDVNFIIAFDPAGSVAERYQLRGMPSSYLIGRDGKIYATHIGFRQKDRASIEQALQRLLQQ